MLVLLLSAGSAAGEDVPYKATTSRAARDAAVQSIPFDELTEEMGDKIRAVVDDPSLYRRTPTQLIRCDAALHTFLVRHPEVIVNIWQVMGITKVNVKRTGKYRIHASDGAGTISDVELVYGRPDLHLFYAEAKYKGSFIPRPLRAKCVMLLKTGNVQAENNETLISDRMDIFIQVENIGAEILAKTLHPLVGRAADYNFSESVGFLARVSETATTNAPGMGRLAARLENVEPAVRQRFRQLTSLAAAKQVQRPNDRQPLETSRPNSATASEGIRGQQPSSGTPTTSVAPAAAEKTKRRLILRR